MIFYDYLLKYKEYRADGTRIDLMNESKYERLICKERLAVKVICICPYQRKEGSDNTKKQRLSSFTKVSCKI